MMYAVLALNTYPCVYSALQTESGRDRTRRGTRSGVPSTGPAQNVAGTVDLKAVHIQIICCKMRVHVGFIVNPFFSLLANFLNRYPTLKYGARIGSFRSLLASVTKSTPLRPQAPQHQRRKRRASQNSSPSADRDREASVMP